MREMFHVEQRLTLLYVSNCCYINCKLLIAGGLLHFCRLFQDVAKVLLKHSCFWNIGGLRRLRRGFLVVVTLFSGWDGYAQAVLGWG